MEKMLTEVCHEVNNYFRRDSIRNTFSVEDGNLVGIPDDFLQEGQFLLIEGSIFNDGVHKYLSNLCFSAFNMSILACGRLPLAMMLSISLMRV